MNSKIFTQNEVNEFRSQLLSLRTQFLELEKATENQKLSELSADQIQQIQEIEEALVKVDNGTYGLCNDCGAEITRVRLQTLPQAIRCNDCEKLFEADNRLRSHTGQLSRPEERPS